MCSASVSYMQIAAGGQWTLQNQFEGEGRKRGGGGERGKGKEEKEERREGTKRMLWMTKLDTI